MIVPSVALALLLSASPAPAAPATPPPYPFLTERKITKLADGVYEIRHPDALGGSLGQANTLVVIGDRSVLVVDSAYLASDVKQDIAQIRTWTRNPVRYLVITHGHYDHVMGDGIYAREFPGLTIVAHRETRVLMSRYVPGYPHIFERDLSEIKSQLATGKDEQGNPLPADRIQGLPTTVPAWERAAPEVRALPETLLPDLVFDQGTLDLDLGNRTVQVKFLGRGNTAGDVVAWLPKEKIVATGDMLVHPVPYTCSGFPVDWEKTLENLALLQPEIVVPGHGEVMHDLKYLHDVHDLLDSTIRQVNAIFQEDTEHFDRSLEHAKKVVDFSAFRDRFPAGDQYNPAFFDRTLPNCLVRNTYYQLYPR
jgi:glyoxylase-like metal-dependent hydrolase (beta-lactamase superfamily II)